MGTSIRFLLLWLANSIDPDFTLPSSPFLSRNAQWLDGIWSCHGETKGFGWHKSSPSHHHFYRWYKPFPIMGGLWPCFTHIIYIYIIQGLVNVHSFITAPIKTLDIISNIYLNDQKPQNWTFTKPCHLTGGGYQVKILYNCLVQRHTHGERTIYIYIYIEGPPKPTYCYQTRFLYIYICVLFYYHTLLYIYTYMCICSITTHQ